MSVVIEQGTSLAGKNTLAAPAQAEFFCASQGSKDALAALDFARGRGLQLHVLGGGSNVVLGEYLPGLWVQQGALGKQVLEDCDTHVVVRVNAGENWHGLVQWSLQQGWCGLENLALIPGTVGAAPIQNIGAYGVELKESVVEVSALDLRTGEVRRFDRSECEFGYRDSVFKGALREQFLIESVTLQLPKQAAPELSYPVLAEYLEAEQIKDPGPREVFDAVIAIRSSKLPDPQRTPTAASFFKNPVVDSGTLLRLQAEFPDLPNYRAEPGQHKLAAGWLIEQCGFKRRQTQAVRVHPEHALVIINPEQRPGAEIQAFAGEILTAVQGRFGIVLEQEPRCYA